MTIQEGIDRLRTRCPHSAPEHDYICHPCREMLAEKLEALIAKAERLAQLRAEQAALVSQLASWRVL